MRYGFKDILNRLDRLDMNAYSTIDTPHMYKMITRDTDRQDLLPDNVLKNLNWDRLKHLALDENEAKASALNESRYRDFLNGYYEYVRSYGPHEGTDI